MRKTHLRLLYLITVMIFSVLIPWLMFHFIPPVYLVLLGFLVSFGQTFDLMISLLTFMVLFSAGLACLTVYMITQWYNASRH